MAKKTKKRTTKKATPQRRATRKPDPPLWIPLTIGTALILFPEPTTTVTGLLIVAGTFGYRFIR
jgi:hypothetical protein